MTTPLDEIVKVAAELRVYLDEIERLSLALGGVSAIVDPDTGEIIRPGVTGLEARYKRARLEAHATSTVKHGRKWTADQHNNAADTASFAEWADWNAAIYSLRSVKERAHSARQVLSTLQTAARVEADLAR